MGLNHKFSLTGTFFSSSNVNKKHSISKNMEQSPNDIKDSEENIMDHDNKSSAEDRKMKPKSRSNSPF